MKTVETKKSSAPANTTSSFFPGKDSKGDFFFSPRHSAGISIQTKLKIGQPGDEYEREADLMADKVVQRLATPEVPAHGEHQVQTKPLAATITPLLQTKCAHCEQEEKMQMMEEEDVVQESPLELQRKPIFESNAEPDDETVQRKCAACEGKVKNRLQAKGENIGFEATDPSLEKRLSSSIGRGSPLPESTRSHMENSFGADFSRVRIHTDSSAEEMSKDLGAQAFTYGSDIYFNSNNYDTNSNDGRHLLAHELTHVVQQGFQRSNGVISQALIQRQGSPKGKLPALSPEELLNFLLTQRGFGTSKPGPPKFDPKGIGKPTGKGYQTYAAVQLIDGEGKQITVATGAYLSGGDVHGEVDAINKLRSSLPKGTKLEGGKMMVAVEQIPCPNCDSAIKGFAKELGVSEYSVYVPQRESLRKPGTSVKPKTAATGAFQGGRGPTTARLAISETLTSASEGSKVLSAEAKLVAKEAAESLKSELRMLRVASFLKTSLAVISGVFDILNAVEFFSMAQNKLSGGAFILTDYLRRAEELDAKADVLSEEYPNVSSKLDDMQIDLLKATMDVSGMGTLTLQLLDFKVQLQEMGKGLDERINSIEGAIKEAEAKRTAAMNILKDPQASASLAAVTFGTGELARLFAISEDLQLIQSRLSSAVEKFKKVRKIIDDDIFFLQEWYDYFLARCQGDPSCKSTMNEGWYQIVVVSAKVPDSFWDTPDVFVSFPRNGLRTSVKDDTTKPVWNERVGYWRMDRLDEHISIRVYDYDPISSNDLLASFDAKLKPSNPEGEVFTLQDSGVSLTISVERTLFEP